MKDTASYNTSFDASKLTRTLLTYVVIAGPFYLVVGLIQAFFRRGFDITRLETTDVTTEATFNYVMSAAAEF